MYPKYSSFFGEFILLKQISIFSLLSLNVFATFPFDQEPCPTLSVKAQCTRGVWLAKLPVPEPWALTGDRINNHPCSNEGEESAKLKWNYAAYHGRMGAICNFSLLDQGIHEIDTIQIVSRAFLSGGENWRSGGYPTYKICDLAQEKCQFLKIPE